MDCRTPAGVNEPLVPLVEREVHAVRVPAGNFFHNLSPAVRDVLGGRIGVDAEALARLGRPRPLCAEELNGPS
eukprot:14601141-Alexandrium_andersonii.AAC.1